MGKNEDVIHGAEGSERDWALLREIHNAPCYRSTVIRMRAGIHTLIATVLVCIATVGYTFRMPEFGRFFRGENDFLPRYAQARMATRSDQFNIDAGYREQERAIGAHIAGAYNDRLPWQSLLLMPIASLPYLAAFWVWTGLNLACFAALVRYWLLPRDLIIWGVLFFPVAGSLIVGQDGLFLALCAAAVLIFAERNSDVCAGLSLALCTAKPHLFLLVPLAIIAQRRWKLLTSAMVSVGGLLLAGSLAAGWDWLPRLMAIMTTLGGQVAGDALRRPSVFQFGVNPATITVAVLLVIGFSLAIWRARNLQTGIALAIIGSILVAPHTAVYDLPVLLVAVPALGLASYGRWLQIALLTPVPYWALLNGAPWNSLLPLMLLVACAISASTWIVRPTDRALELIPPSI